MRLPARLPAAGRRRRAALVSHQGAADPLGAGREAAHRVDGRRRQPANGRSRRASSRSSSTPSTISTMRRRAFFSAEPDGRIVYLNATLAEWLGIDIARFEAGVADACRHRARRTASPFSRRRSPSAAQPHRDHRPRPGQAERPEPAGPAPPPRAGDRRRRAGGDAHAGPQPQPGRGRLGSACARPKSASPASSTTRRSPSPRSTGAAASAAPTRRSPPVRAARATRERPQAAGRSRRAGATGESIEAALAAVGQGASVIPPIDATLAGEGERAARFYINAGRGRRRRTRTR